MLYNNHIVAMVSGWWKITSLIIAKNELFQRQKLIAVGSFLLRWTASATKIVKSQLGKSSSRKGDWKRVRRILLFASVVVPGGTYSLGDRLISHTAWLESARVTTNAGWWPVALPYMHRSALVPSTSSQRHESRTKSPLDKIPPNMFIAYLLSHCH